MHLGVVMEAILGGRERDLHFVIGGTRRSKITLMAEANSLLVRWASSRCRRGTMFAIEPRGRSHWMPICLLASSWLGCKPLIDLALPIQ
jgi:hypothetical protein